MSQSTKTELIHPHVLQAFREHFVREGVLRTIDDAFAAQGIRPKEGSALEVDGERRQRVEEYYRSLDLSSPEDSRRLLAVFGSLLRDLEYSAEDSHESGWPSTHHLQPAEWARNLRRVLQDYGYEYADGRVRQTSTAPWTDELMAHARALDLPNILEQLRRLQADVDSDPRLAIGTAKELVETVCKSILAERGVTVAGDWKFPRLVGETRRELRLLPEQVNEGTRGKDSIDRVLGSLGSIAQGINELRGLYGTGHGPDGRARGLHGRHARLAVGMASTLVAFLLETHRESR